MKIGSGRAVLSFLLYTCDVQRKCGGDLNIPKPTKRRQGHASKAHANFARMPMPACSDWDPFPSRAKKTSPLCYPNPSPGCGQPAPPMQCWRLRNTVLKQEGNDYFAPGNQSPIRLCWQPTLHPLGVRGCGTARMEGRFFRSGRTRVRWCCIAIIVCALCGSWMMLLFVGTTTSCRHVYERGFVGAVGAVVGAV